MNTRTIITGVIVLLIILIGGYFIFFGSSSGSASSQTAAAAQARVEAQEVKVGTGTEAKPGDKVSLLYVGYLGHVATTTIFDASAFHNNDPLVFTLGATAGAVVPIAGFQIGVNSMKEGGERLIAIPPSLGYGDKDVHQDPNDPKSKVIIPANSTIIFDVLLMKVEKGAASPAPAATE